MMDIMASAGVARPPTSRFSHLVIWVKLAAVHIIVVASEHSDQLSRVKGVHGHRAATGHKHKLWTAALRYRELEPFTTFIAHFPIIYLRERNPTTHTRGAQ